MQHLISGAEGKIYVFDTSALIKLNGQPARIFETLWKNIEDLTKQKRAIAPQEVFDELMAKQGAEDEIMRWSKRNSSMFQEATESTLETVREIMEKFPKFVDIEKETPEADPFVIALAINSKATVVSQEKENPNVGGRPHIPNVCKHYKIAHLDLFGFIEEMGWKF